MRSLTMYGIVTMLLVAVASASPLVRYDGTVATMAQLYPLSPNVVDPNELHFAFDMRGSSANGDITLNVDDPSTLIVDGGAGTRAQNITLQIRSSAGSLSLSSLQNHLSSQAFGEAKNFSLWGSNTIRDGLLLQYAYGLDIAVPGRAVRVLLKTTAVGRISAQNAAGYADLHVFGLAAAYMTPNPFGTPNLPYQFVAIYGHVDSRNEGTSVVRGFRALSPYSAGAASPYLRAANVPVSGLVRDATLNGNVMNAYIDLVDAMGSVQVSNATLVAAIRSLDESVVRVESAFITVDDGRIFLMDDAIIRLVQQ